MEIGGVNMKIKLTKNELDEMETKIREQLAFAKKVQSSTKDLEKRLEIVFLAKVGYSAMLD
jgi:hypothetical protein